MRLPSEEEALQFAVLLTSGMPPSEAIRFFTADEDDAAQVAGLLAKWMKSRAVKKAQATLMSKPWTDMSLDERMKCALDHTYNTMAFLLFSHHYAEVDSQTKAKLDTARTAIEAKLAGMAGQSDQLSQFFAAWDVKVKAGQAARPVKKDS